MIKIEIYYEDCIQGLNKVKENSINLLIADPPFGINFNGKGSQYNRKKESVVDGYREVIENYSEFTKQWISKIPRVMKNNGSGYIVSGFNNLEHVLREMRLNNLYVINHIIWKYQFGVYTKRKYVTSHYHILFFARNPKDYYFNKIDKYPEDVWIIMRKYAKGIMKNGTKLPLDLVSKMVSYSSKKNDIVLDPFLGNGTTAQVCKQLNRNCIGFEINLNMKDVIENNLNMICKGD